MKTGTAVINECIGVLLEIKDFNKPHGGLTNTDVRVIIEGQTKDFSMDEFKDRLGFDNG